MNVGSFFGRMFGVSEPDPNTIKPTFQRGIESTEEIGAKKGWVSPFLNGTFPMPKSKRPAAGRSGKSNRKRLATNAKLKRRRAK